MSISPSSSTRSSRGDFRTHHWPIEIRVHRAERYLEVDFDTGETVRLPAELMRIESPSAEVQGHSAAGKKTVPGKRHVSIASVEPVGNYAVRVGFDDGHDTGIFTWRYLWELGEEQDTKWEGYLAALARDGLSRDPV